MVGMAVASVLVGLVVGVLSGMLGIGGGTILVPVFKLGYAMESIACTATSLFTIIPTSVSGALSHLRNKTCIPKLGVAAGIGGAITSPVGVWLAAASPDWAIMIAAAIIIAYSSYTMLKKAFNMKPPAKKAEPSATSTAAVVGVAAVSADCATAADGVASVSNNAVASQASSPASPAASSSSSKASDIPPVPQLTNRQLLTGTCIGLVAGLASGYVGVGGGFIMVPMMIQLIRTPMKLTSGTSLIAVMILAIPGVIYQAFLGNVNWVAGIAVACGSIPGATIGARLVPYIPERTLRFIFGGFLLVASVMLVVNQMGLI